MKNAAYQIIEGKGATNYAIGLATAKILEAMLHDENRVLPVSSLLSDYRPLGAPADAEPIGDVCLSVPCIVNRSGVEAALPIPLNEAEAAGLRNSASASGKRSGRWGCRNKDEGGRMKDDEAASRLHPSSFRLHPSGGSAHVHTRQGDRVGRAGSRGAGREARRDALCAAPASRYAAGGRDDAKIVAVLHDVIEDTPTTPQDLYRMGFSEPVVLGVLSVTRPAGESYADFVIRSKANPLGRVVKLADLTDNFDLPRTLVRAASLDRDLARLRRYVLSYKFLMDELSEGEYRAAMGGQGVGMKSQIGSRKVECWKSGVWKSKFGRRMREIGRMTSSD